METAFRDNLFPREWEVDWYRALTELLPVGVFLTDATGKCRFVNQLWCELAGLSVEQATDRGWLQSIHPDDRQQVATLWEDAVRNNQPFSAEFRLRSPHRNITWINANARAVRAEDNSLLGFIGTYTDITAKRQRIEELEAYQRRIRQTIEQMPLLLCAFDARGLICAWNSEAERVTGFSAAKMIGNPAALKTLFPSPQQRATLTRQLRDPDDDVYNWEFDLTASDGTRKTISWSSFARHAPITGWANWGIGFDVTARNRLARDLKERVKEINCLYQLSHLQKQTQLPLGEFLQQAVKLIPPACQHPDLAVARIHYQDASYQSGQFQWTGWCLASPFQVRGQIRGKVEICYLADRGAPGEVSFLQEEQLLLDEIAFQVADFIEHQLATEDQTLLSELSAKTEELEQFSCTVSHDLKTPMTAIGGYAQYLLHQLEAGEVSGAGESARRIAEIIERMNLRLEEILKLARIGKVAELSQRISLSDLFSETIKDLKHRLSVEGIEVRVSGPFPTVVGDPVRLQEVIENLLDNAIKYSRQNRHPVIDIGVRQKKGESVFFIRDNGIGIDPEQIECIFELFRRLDTSVPGEGTGLAIVKRIIEAHGGRVWAESQGTGTGTCVCFTLGQILE